MKTNTLDFDAQALREKILDLAMRGKLVPQDPNDEPASVLLEKIKAEKEQLIKDKKIKKSKPLAPITDDERPFDIPDSWEWVRLGDVNTYNSESVHPDRTPDKTFELYSVPIFPTRKPEIIKGEEIRSNKQAVETGDVLLCKINPRINRVWKVSNFTDNENIASTEWIVVRQREITTEYLRYSLMAPYFRNLLQSNVSGVGGSLTRAKPREVRNYVLPIPPLSEQSRIAAKIAQLFALLRKVESSTQQYAKLQTLLKSKVLDLAMRGKLVEQDPHDEPASALLEKIKIDTNQRIEIQKIKKIKFAKHSYDDQIKYSIPDTWVWTRIGDILYKLTDGVHQRPNYTNEGVPFLSVKDMSQGTIDFSDCKYISLEDHEKIYPRCNSEYGDVLLSKVGTTGVPAIVETKEIFDLFVSVALLKFNHKMINQDFLRYLIMSPIVQQQVSINTRGVGNKNWVLRDIAGTLIPLPPKEQQNKIANMLSKLLFLI